MSQLTLANKVDILERRMDTLEQLPARFDRIEAQLLQFREEVREEFSAMRGGLREEVREELSAMRGGLREEIRAGDDETRRQMRVLHEEVIGRLTLIQEGRVGRKGAATRRSTPDTKR